MRPKEKPTQANIFSCRSSLHKNSCLSLVCNNLIVINSDSELSVFHKHRTGVWGQAGGGDQTLAAGRRGDSNVKKQVLLTWITFIILISFIYENGWFKSIWLFSFFPIWKWQTCIWFIIGWIASNLIFSIIQIKNGQLDVNSLLLFFSDWNGL